MDASLAFWIVMFVAIIGALVLFEVGLFLRRVVNLQRSEYREPEGNQFFDALGANPNRGRYS